MDIAFHYFAVKALAVRAGFDEDDAQLIAEYSQMVDDFDFYQAWICKNAPNYVKQPGFDIISSIVGIPIVNPVQTGFLADGHIINIDYFLLATGRFQRLTCAPFHFIYNDRDQIGRKNYRVYPAVDNDLSLIWEMMDSARSDYLAAKHGLPGGIYGNNRRFKRKALMKIGLLLHIFADTTAHQLFSGFDDGVNDVDLVFVKNNATGADETEKYKNLILDFIKKFPFVPKIGHMFVEHVPDLTHLTFGMRYKESGKKVDYTRSNTAEFIMRCEQIIRYLFSCTENEMMPDDEWMEFSEGLSRCFMADISTCSNEKSMVKVLRKVWENEFGGFFYIDPQQIKDDYILETEPLTNDEMMQLQEIPEEYRSGVKASFSEDFYLLNVCAEEVLVKLYGDYPRKLIGDEEMYPTAKKAAD